MSVKVGLKKIEIWNESLEDAVVKYEQEQNEMGQIVFYGSSSFTRWSEAYGMKPMREVLLGKSGAPCVINRGFGSSCPEHQLYYYPRMVRPLAPKVLVYICRGNNTPFGYSFEEGWELAQRVIAYTLTDFPDAHIYLCGSQPIKREYNYSEAQNYKRFDTWLKAFAEATPNCHFIDMMKYDELKRKDIFVEDGVHFNQTGYDIYAEIFKKELKDELDRF